MSVADKAKKTLLGIEIQRDELACRIAEACTGMRRPPLVSASGALDQMASVNIDMVAGFRKSADAAVIYFHECINAGRQPS